MLTDMKKECLRCRKCVIGGCYPVEGDDQKQFISNVFSTGSKMSQIMFVGLNPSLDEVVAQKPFVGGHGKLLTETVEHELGINPSRLYLTNLVKCHISDNRRPSRYEINTCSEAFLKREIQTVKPKIVVALGKLVLENMCGVKSIRRHRGYEMLSSKYGVMVLPTYSPGKAILDNPELLAEFHKDIASLTKYL